MGEPLGTHVAGATSVAWSVAASSRPSPRSGASPHKVPPPSPLGNEVKSPFSAVANYRVDFHGFGRYGGAMHGQLRKLILTELTHRNRRDIPVGLFQENVPISSGTLILSDDHSGRFYPAQRIPGKSSYPKLSLRVFDTCSRIPLTGFYQCTGNPRHFHVEF